MTTLPRFALLLIFPALQTSAQPSLPRLQPPIHPISSQEYRTRIGSLTELIRACRANPAACDSAKVGDDLRIEDHTENADFQIRWQWLRKVFDDAKDPALSDRNTLLDQASGRLAADLTEDLAATSSDPKPTAFPSARRAADFILARPEFRIVGNDSWFDRQIAKFWSWFNRIFTAASDFGQRSPWLGKLLEWGFVSLAAVALLIWARRTLARQRLAISLGGPALASDWQLESAGWAEQAAAAADSGNWREAIHCLYWASIVALERRRLWSRNYSRTPREYLRLLERHSPQQAALGTLTSLFERIWYGLHAALPDDYTRARALFEDLRRPTS